jgi:hypothetical protein
MKEEEIIRKRCGNQNPFRLPERYFDDFTSQLMEKLPERDSHSIHLKSRNDRSLHTLRPILYVAASLCFAVFSTVAYLSKNVDPGKVKQNSANISVKPNSDELIDRTADYAMMDNHDIYACVSSNE